MAINGDNDAKDVQLSNHVDRSSESLGQPNLKRRRRFRKFLLVAALLLVICAAVPIWYLGKYLVAPTIEAGEGAACPACAVDEYLHDGPLNPLGGDDLAVANVLCGKNKTQLRAQLRDMAKTYQAAAQKWGVSFRLEAGVAEGDSEQEQADGKVSLTVPVRQTHEKLGGIIASKSERTWRFEVVREDGWRICAVEHPDVCTEMIRCEWSPTPSIAPSYPEPRQWDARVRWNCLPDAPAHFRPLDPAKCVAPEGWSPPGPYECASDYTLPRGPQTIEACRKLGWIVT